MEIEKLVEAQRKYFRTGKTRPVKFRRKMLLRLRRSLFDHEKMLAEAMYEDMNKSRLEVYMTETGMVLDEIRFHLKHIDGWVRPKLRRTPMAQFPSKSFVRPEPRGVALIMAPWNYPIQLALEPLVGAISAGCTAIIKLPSYAPKTSEAVARVIEDVFPPEYIAVVQGGREENRTLLDQKFDYIFFTGSREVGKVVMSAAAEHLTPVTLELGGKSPVIVDETADIRLAARRIAFGKVLNGGQTCVAPDYLLIHEDIKEKFITAYREAIGEFFPGGDMSDMNVIINEKHYARVSRLLKDGRAVVGGGTDSSRRFIEPTLLDQVSPDSDIMKEEIFGPILPVLTFRRLEECVEFISSRPHPLALYLFTKSRAAERKVLGSCISGGACVNDTIMHLATSRMPFGGVGDSGMGGYHGKSSFDTFTHYRSVLKKSNRLDIPVRYRPYSDRKENLIRLLMK